MVLLRNRVHELSAYAVYRIANRTQIVHDHYLLNERLRPKWLNAKIL
jgi:hypothetical protein